MATTNRFRIGTTSGTLSDREYPTSDPIPINKGSQFLDIQESQSGDRIMNFIAKKKEDFSLVFTNKIKADYDSITSFCDVPVAYYVVVQNSDTSVKLIDGYYYLRLNAESINVKTDTFRYNFEVELIAE